MVKQCCSRCESVDDCVQDMVTFAGPLMQVERNNETRVMIVNLRGARGAGRGARGARLAELLSQHHCSECITARTLVKVHATHEHYCTVLDIVHLYVFLKKYTYRILI